jgi:hypothetical protein
MKLRFTDGVEIITSGPYRTLHLYDGWYVVGHGDLHPCESKTEADDLSNELRKIKEKRILKNHHFRKE